MKLASIDHAVGFLGSFGLLNLHYEYGCSLILAKMREKLFIVQSLATSKSNYPFVLPFIYMISSYCSRNRDLIRSSVMYLIHVGMLQKLLTGHE